MTPDEIVSHIEKFGTPDEQAIAEALYEAEPEVCWDDCPYCDDANTQVGGLEQQILDALSYLENDELGDEAKIDRAREVLS